MYFECRVLILSYYLYVTFIYRNLTSLTYLGKCDYTSILKDIAIIKKGKMFICSGSITNDLYLITPYSYTPNNSEI